MVGQLYYPGVLNMGPVTLTGHEWAQAEIVTKVLWLWAFTHEIVISFHRFFKDIWNTLDCIEATVT